MLYYLQHEKVIDKTGWIYYSYGELEWISIGLDDIKSLYKEIVNTIPMIQGHKFDANPGEACRFCDFKNICDPGKFHVLKAKQKTADSVQKKLQKANSPLLLDNEEISF
jgi:hypothetical protein